MSKAKKALAACSVGLALTFTSTGGASADVGVMASGTIKDPWRSGNTIYGSANLWGPNPVGTKVCVELHALHPYGPDTVFASTCKSINAGTVTTSGTLNTCVAVKTYAWATYNGRVTWGPTESPKYTTFCR
ncbi:hypothetical protein ACIGW7_38840 [Streptomyces sp. NPDC053253]|uniref:hypothetical protein n=1 Tax=Streptomyces sp. NPDC053253 TaxID=3365699 RepID=UPI0037D44155